MNNDKMKKIKNERMKNEKNEKIREKRKEKREREKKRKREKEKKRKSKKEKWLLNPCGVVAQLFTSQPVTVDTTVTFISYTDVLNAPGKDFDDWGFTFNGYAGTLDPAYREDSETITNSGDGDSTTRTAVCNLAVPPHDAHTEGSTESGEESWKQRLRSLQTTVPEVRNVRSGRQHGTIRANYDIQVRFQD